jgi:hypothetical protein
MSAGCDVDELTGQGRKGPARTCIDPPTSGFATRTRLSGGWRWDGLRIGGGRIPAAAGAERGPCG